MASLDLVISDLVILRHCEPNATCSGDTIGQDPDTPGRLLGAVTALEGSVSTSGGYHNFFEVDGRRYGHILDPRTLRPSETSLSVTVIARDATLADGLSKPAFLLGPRAGLALVESFPGRR